jgi:undecaprenyl-diphosphatase
MALSAPVAQPAFVIREDKAERCITMAKLFPQRSTPGPQAPLAPIRSARTPAPLLWALALIATVVFAILAFFAHMLTPFPADLPITQAAQTIRAGWFAQFMDFISEPGFPPQVWVLSALIVLILFISGLRWEAAAELVGGLGIGAVATLVKDIVNRARPSPALVHVVRPNLNNGRLSFPAGHVVSYVTLFGFLLFLSLHMRPSWRRVVERLGFGALIVLIGISRIYQGEHWASDVLAGYLLGFVGLVLTIWLYRWAEARFGSHSQET